MPALNSIGGWEMCIFFKLRKLSDQKNQNILTKQERLKNARMKYIFHSNCKSQSFRNILGELYAPGSDNILIIKHCMTAYANTE